MFSKNDYIETLHSRVYNKRIVNITMYLKENLTSVIVNHILIMSHGLCMSSLNIVF